MTPGRLSVPDPKRLGSRPWGLCRNAERPVRVRPAADARFARSMREIHGLARVYNRRFTPACWRSRWLRPGLDDRLGRRLRQDSLDPCRVLQAARGGFDSRRMALVTATSSGTTGQKSQMFFDRWSVLSARRMVEFIFAFARAGCRPETFVNYLLYTYEVEAGSEARHGDDGQFPLHLRARARRCFSARCGRTGAGGVRFRSVRLHRASAL